MHLGISADEWFGFSDAERHQHVQALRGHFTNYLRHLLSQLPVEYDGKIIVDTNLFHDVICHYYEDLKRWSDTNDFHPNDLKQKAIYAFWIRKLKPVSLSKPLPLAGDTGNWINEILAINIALIELDAIHGRDFSISLNPDLRHDLLYFFRYKSVSPHALYLILASLYA